MKNEFDLEALLNNPAQVQTVKVEGLKSPLFMRSMTVEKLRIILDKMQKDVGNNRADMIAETVVNKDGQPLHSSETWQNFPADKAVLFGKIWEACARVNGLLKPQEIEDLGKQSGETQP